jgi:DNA repair protein RecN (Recombination protein N)
MLVQLNISNFAIIDHLETHFKPGLNILTGETGAGKSIIINAVNLILGGRASSDLIRTGSEEARVEALFNIPKKHSIEELLSALGLPFDGELLIQRTISREGPNRVTINGSMATLQILSKLGLSLISISGQHEHQLLLRPENHLYLLDEFGGLNEEREALAVSYRAHQSLKEDLKGLEKEIREGEQRQELSAFQADEIGKADVKKGEDALLVEEKDRLRHAEMLRQIVTESYQTLYENEDAVISSLSQCIKKIEKGIEVDRRLSGIRDAITSAHLELEEAALDLRNFQKSITIDPARLEHIEERIQLINRLKRKYGSTIEEILKFKEGLSQQIDHLESQRKRLEKVRMEMNEIEKVVVSQAVALSMKRKNVAKKLQKAVEVELNRLDMVGTRFEAYFYPTKAGNRDEPNIDMGDIRGDGYDNVELMISPNIGEELRPLSRIASGGELSRIMLALKTILARRASVETIIFDEVDSGIGGATAEVVGEKLQSLAQYHQILCITHLPQIASKGTTHFLVKKQVVSRRTQTVISKLNAEERLMEIARLLGGRTISKKTVAHAKEMLTAS